MRTPYGDRILAERREPERPAGETVEDTEVEDGIEARLEQIRREHADAVEAQARDLAHRGGGRVV